MGQATFTWFGVSTGGFQAIASNTDLLLNLAVGAISGTVRRFIYTFQVSFSAPVDGAVATGAFGLIMADATAVAAGVASLSKPITDGDQEWLVTTGYGMTHQVQSATEQKSHNFVGHGDVRGMRKFKQSDVFALVVENEAGAAIQFALQGRVLCSV